MTSRAGEEWTRVVLAAGKKDAGLLIITFVEKAILDTGNAVIEHFCNTLNIDDKLK